MFELKSLILGIIQGLTEFIPVSSSGHLVLANHFLRFELQDLTFEVMLHIGTLFSVLIYFRKDIYKLLNSLVKVSDNSSEHVANRKILLYLAVATIVTGVIGVVFKDIVEGIFHNPLFSSLMLFVTGAIVFSSDFIKDRGIPSHNQGYWRSIVIGASQALALLPGISRSGSTITASLAVGIKRTQAARFSFLLSIPAILGAAILDMRKITSIDSSLYLGYLIGTIAAFISGYLVIALLLEMIKKRKLKYVAFYCWAVATVTLVLITIGY